MEKEIISKKEALSENVTFESERLCFAPAWNVDSLELAVQANNENTAIMVGDAFPYPYGEKEADSFKAYSKEAWQKGTEYSFAIRNKGTSYYMGNIGFKISEDGQTVTNIGYWLGVDFHGKGFATEALLSTIAFIQNNFPEVFEIKASALFENTASQKVLEKAGFVKTGEVEEEASLRDGSLKKNVKYNLKID